MAHPIENIMQTTMESIRNMVDVNTIVGDTVVMGDGTVIIPISKVSFGFVAGGGEYACGGGGQAQGQKEGSHQQAQGGGGYPFAGGTGAGVSICPMAFLVVSEGEVNLLPVQFNTGYERLVERIPDLVCELKQAFRSKHGAAEKGEGPHAHHHRRWGQASSDEDDIDTDGSTAQDANVRPPKNEL